MIFLNMYLELGVMVMSEMVKWMLTHPYLTFALLFFALMVLDNSLSNICELLSLLVTRKPKTPIDDYTEEDTYEN